MRDAFGIEIEQGDMILSAAHTTGAVKIGTAVLREGKQLAMRPHATRWTNNTKVAPVGAMVVVLRKADGSIPSAVREAFE